MNSSRDLMTELGKGAEILSGVASRLHAAGGTAPKGSLAAEDEAIAIRVMLPPHLCCASQERVGFPGLTRNIFLSGAAAKELSGTSSATVAFAAAAWFVGRGDIDPGQRFRLHFHVDLGIDMCRVQ